MLTQDPCVSFWFNRFAEGCRRRMGQDWRPNKAISVELMGELLKVVEQKVMDSDNLEGRMKWMMTGGYFVVCYVVSLQSTEGLLCDLEALIEHYVEDRNYVFIPLLDQVKGEHHSRQHLMPCVETTDSGIEVKKWIKRLLAVHSVTGRRTGPVFINEEGVQSTTSEMNDAFHEIMLELFNSHRTLFDVEVKSESDIQEMYNVYRSIDEDRNRGQSLVEKSASRIGM